MKCGISIDMDFFCREESVWDWGHSEDKAIFLKEIWAIRGQTEDLKGMTDPKVYADFLPKYMPMQLIRKGFKFNKNTKLGVSYTHKDAKEFFEGLKAEQIFNFDAHHDCGYIQADVQRGKLDCGNWGWYLFNKGKNIKVIYPKWRNVEEDANLAIRDFDGCKFGELEKQKYTIEGIFIAQSPAWVPPYFDKMMVEMINTIQILCRKPNIDFGGKIVKR